MSTSIRVNPPGDARLQVVELLASNLPVFALIGLLSKVVDAGMPLLSIT
jgi:hypothetical protein